VKPKVLVALSTFAEFGDAPLELLKQSGLDYRLNPLGRRLAQEEIIEMGKDCQGILAGVEPYDDYVFDHLPELRCISRCGVGIDNISLAKAKERGIVIKNTPDVVVLPAAELTIAMIFDLLRKLTFHTRLLRSKQWQKIPGNLLAGKKVGILGLGRIGKKVAEILVKLGAEVYGADLRPDRNWAAANGIKILSTDLLLKDCDIISLHISILENKRFILGKKEIASIKAGALIVNVSRGEVIDEKSLYEALKSGHLGGAALDVFSKEPYHGPLCELDNIILTPHVATLTVESRLQMEVEAVTNLVIFFQIG
jgi:D-3-phosphoglycerate dehydrogenase / 2-oxoglutarate reductase